MIKERKRKARSDAGQLRVTARDRAALAWLVDMRAAWEDDVAVLLARQAGREPSGSVGGTVHVVRRWQRLGLATAERIVVGQPRVIVATQAAADLLHLPGRVAPPAWTQVTHVATTARVRLVLEAEYGPALAEWRSDRAMRAEAAEARGGVATSSPLGRSHIPDAVVVLADGHRCAIEVELTPKPGARLARIVKDVRSGLRWEQVRYFVSPAAASIVRAVVEAEGGGKNPISIEPVPGAPAAALGTG